jgi:hypothetical protein
MMTKFGAADAFLRVQLPNYEIEHFQVLCWLAASASLWLGVRHALSTTDTIKKFHQLARALGTRILPAMFLYGVAMFGFLLTAFLVVAFWVSPHNTYTPRRVFQAPALNQTECDILVRMAHHVAAREYERQEEARVMFEVQHGSDDDFPGDKHQDFLEFPQGWRKQQQHGGYPTCDLSLVHDSFTKQDRDYLSDLLDRRVAPIVSRIFDIPPSALRANDMFIIRSDYNADSEGEEFDTHIDESDITISILLNQDFQGGGTQYWNRFWDQSFANGSPNINRAGELVTHASDIRHRPLRVIQGTQYILMANLAVDSIDPWTKQSNGLSLFASWFNLRWLGTRFEDGRIAAKRNRDGRQPQLWRWLLHHPYVVDYLLFGMVQGMEFVLDKYAPHAVESLVAVTGDDNEDDAKANRFVQSLDSHYKKVGQYQAKANWYKGQMINRDMDGSIHNEWTMREENPGAWSEL